MVPFLKVDGAAEIDRGHLLAVFFEYVRVLARTTTNIKDRVKVAMFEYCGESLVSE
jgi:hypothetical protein